MDCEKIRDRFSSLWEKELAPFEEKILKEHLSLCPGCRREFERFEKTMGWLHSVGEAEVPEGFLFELNKKREEKKKAISLEEPQGGWLHFPRSLKLPAQAVAMMVVVFLVLYLTKMMPMEGGRLNETKQTSPPLSLHEKQEQDLARLTTPPQPKTSTRSVGSLGSKAGSVSEGEIEKGRSEAAVSEPLPSARQASPPAQSRGRGQGVEGLPREGERKVLDISQETPRPKDSERAKSPASGEKRKEGTDAPESLPPKAEVMAYQQTKPGRAGREKATSPEPEKMKKESAGPETSLVASKPPGEIILKVSDRKMVVSRLHELVKQFGGEVVAAEGDIFVASLPTASLAEFEKELAGFRSPAKADRLIAKKEAGGSVKLEEEVKRKERDEKRKEPAKLAAETESRTTVRILLVEE